MEKSKLITALSTFTKAELSKFKNFVQSPYFNKNDEVTTLFEYLRKYAPHFPVKKIKKEAVYRKLYPGKPFDRGHLNHLMNYLLRLVEQFIALEKFYEEPVKEELELMASCIDRKLDKHYARYEKRAQGLLQHQKERDVAFYNSEWKMAELSAAFFHNQSSRTHDHQVQLLADRLDVFYLVSKLKYSCTMLDRKNSVKLSYEINLIGVLDELILRTEFMDVPAVKVYFYLYAMLKEEENDGHYQTFKNQLERHQSDFSKEDIKELYYWTINYCIRKIRSGNRLFIEELLHLYLNGIEEAILLENGELSPWTFKNIVKLGLGTKRYGWTENFVKAYIDKLPYSFREDALHYNLANLHFIKGAYGAAIAHLNQVEFKDPYYLLDSRVLLLKVYYEEDEIEVMLALAQSFRVFLKRNKVFTNSVKNVYLNFIKILVKLDRLYKERNVEELIETIEQMPSLTDREWLLNKAKAHRKKMPASHQTLVS